MLRAGIDRKYAFILLAVSGALLLLGIVFRPAQAPGEEALSEIEIARLQRLAEQRRLRDLSSFLSEAATQAATGLVSVLPSRTTGLLWGSLPAVLVAKGTAKGDTLTAVAWDGTPNAVRRTSSDPSWPFEMLSPASAASLVPAPRAATPPVAGEWILAVARGPSNEAVFAHGLYQGVAAAHCGEFLYQAMQTSIPLSAALVGGGVFTIDGRLLGFIAECSGAPIMISAGAVEQALGMPTPLETRLEREYGLMLTKAGEAQRVTGVWAGSRAAAAGIRPGDQLSPEIDLKRLADHPGEEHEIEVTRGERTVTVRLAPLEEMLAASTLGFTLAAGDEPGQVVVRAVAPESPAKRSGLQTSDIVVRIGNTAVRDPITAVNTLERSRDSATTVTLERDGKQLEVLLER